MLSSREIQLCPRDDHATRENTETQPLKRQKVFNRTDLITEGWFPIGRSSLLKKGQAKSFLILKQRIAVFRSHSGNLGALDSFCPHLGADLGNGEVVGESLRCFYHHWSFDSAGNLTSSSCDKSQNLQERIKQRSYPVEEKYGFIWVYSGKEASHPLPNPPALKGETSAYHFKRVKLFAHHHVMMTNAIDLQHFKSVHGLDIKFDYQVTEKEPGVFIWSLEGEIPKDSLFLKLAHYLLGGHFRYEALFAGGSVTSLSYGVGQKFRGKGFDIPPVHIFWGATPLKEGVSAVDIFFVVKKYSGVLAPFKKYGMLLLTTILLILLNDDDIKAFPHMRYNVGHLTTEDNSLAKFIQLTNKLKISSWSNRSSDEENK